VIERRGQLAEWLSREAGASRATITTLSRLSGGAIQENWALDVDFEGGRCSGSRSLVIRTDARSSIPVSRSRPEEFALIRAAYAAGVRVPEPFWVCRDPEVIGRPFFVMQRMPGIASGPRLVKDDDLVPDRPRLLEELGRHLARIHTIRPPRADLSFLDLPERPAGEEAIAACRLRLDAQTMPQPVMEWGLRWLARHVPAARAAVLCHNDFRTGNYLVAGGHLSAILDWEFAGWGDPMSDIGWFCAPCWRFGRRSAAAGGIGDADDLFRGYEAESGSRLDRGALQFWIVMATVRWAVVAVEQATRHVTGREVNLELALTAHLLPELELDILEMTREA
jgi:aminoglycoside phosphotransferase (APT) family kinase protein